MRWLSSLIVAFAVAVPGLDAALAAPASQVLAPAGSHAPAAPARGVSAVSDRLVVAFEDDAGASERKDSRLEAGTTVVSSLGSKAFQLLRPDRGRTVAEAVAALRDDRDVRAVQRDVLLHPTAVPNDPLFGQQWGLHNTGLRFNAAPATAGGDIGALGAWSHSVGSPSVVVADIDSGYRPEHPDLAPVLWSDPQDGSHGRDYIDGDNDPTDEELVGGGHGAHTAGIIGAAGDNGLGVTGVAQNVRIMPLRVCDAGGCRTSDIVAAIAFAGQHGARVANLSLGGPGATPVIDAAIAAQPQTLFVIAAGNGDPVSRLGVDNDSSGPNRSFPCINSPPAGSVDNVICVAATDPADALASFSNYGRTTVDLGAPGTDILSTYPSFDPALIGDEFEGADFATRWPLATFSRVAESPLTSFGLANSPQGSAQPADDVRTATSLPVVLQDASSCWISLRADLTMSATHEFEYGIVVSGTFLRIAIAGPGSASGVFWASAGELPAGASIQLRVSYTTGANPSPGGDGAYVDDVVFNCLAPVGQGKGTAFLDGTSMAAPMVSGTAALLSSRVPGATVAQLRGAILQSTDPVPALAATTVSGGRLNAGKAMSALLTSASAAPSAAPAMPVPTISEAKPRATTTTTKPRCVVPKLKGRTLAGARSALKRARCRLGTVSKPRRGERLRVKSTSPRAGIRRSAGTKVKVALTAAKRRTS